MSNQLRTRISTKAYVGKKVLRSDRGNYLLSKFNDAMMSVAHYANIVFITLQNIMTKRIYGIIFKIYFISEFYMFGK